MQRAPLVGIATNPLIWLQPSDMQVVPVGKTLLELAPNTDKPVICSLSSVAGYVPREHWNHRMEPDEIAIFEIDPPGDRDILRVALLIAVAVLSSGAGAALGLTGTAATVANVAAAIAGSIFVNALLPPTAASITSGPAAGNVFSGSLTGNEARLDQPIWKTCGRRLVTPPFAGTPYVEYVSKDGTDVDNDQYFYAVYAIGIGNYDIEGALFAKTHLSRFRDVTVARYLAPGELPTVAMVNVVTCPEVSNAPMDSGRYIGGFAACKPGQHAASIGIDIGAPRGGGVEGQAITMRWRIEVRAINEFGIPVGPWSILATEARTVNTNTGQRWSYRYYLDLAIRPEVRVVRLDVKDTRDFVVNDLAWLAMRCYLNETASLNVNCAHYELVMRASEQLNSQTNSDLRLILNGKSRTWTPTGGWGTEAYHRNPGLWCLDLLSSSTWGLDLPDDRIDLQSFYEFSLTNDARQDRFDYTFDATVDGWEALQLIARAGRARCFRRYGVVTIARDELATLPVTAFTPRNTAPGSMSMQEKHWTTETPDGVILEYTNNVTWDITRIECPTPTDDDVSGVDEHFDQVTLLMRLRGDLSDESLLANTVDYFNGNATVAPTFTSLPTLYDQPVLEVGVDQGDHTSWTGVDMVVGPAEFDVDDFTIEGKFYWPILPSDLFTAILFDLSSSGTGNYSLRLIYGWPYYYLAFRSDTGPEMILARILPRGGQPAVRTWHEYSVERLNGKMLVHIDGLFMGLVADSGDYDFPGPINNAILSFGAIRDPLSNSGALTNYIGEQRVTHGVARYGAKDYTPTGLPYPSPGFDNGGVTRAMLNPVVKRLDGVTGSIHAHREGIYEAANMAYRNRTVKCTTEMQAVLVNYMAPVKWQPEIAGYGQSGDVAYWDIPTLVMGLSEPPVFGDDDVYLTLVRDDGSLTAPVVVTPGPTTNDVTLPTIPDFPIVIDDGTRERPKFLLGPLVGSDELVKISAISDGGKDNGAQLFTVEGLVDDDRVHTADNYLLPGPGEIQDPIQVDDSDPGNDTLALIQLHDYVMTDGANVFGGGSFVKFRMTNNGRVVLSYGYGDEFPPPTGNDWSGITIETSLASTYEVRATAVSFPGQVSGSAFDTWLNLGTDRYWQLDVSDLAHPVGDRTRSEIKLEIREVGATVAQETRTLSMAVNITNIGV